VGEAVDLDALVSPMRLRRVSGAEIDGVDPALREVRDVGPCLLGLERACAGGEQRLHERALRRHGARWRVARDLDLGGRAEELPEMRLGVGRRPVGGVAEAERRDCAIGNDVVSRSGCEARHAHDLAKRQPADDGVARRLPERGREALDRALDRVLRLPRTGRVAAHARKDDPGADVSEAAGVHLTIRRLEEDHERRIVDRPRFGEQGRERVLARWELLAAEEQQSDVVRAALLVSEVVNELQRYRQATFHVARSQPVHRTVGDPAREVVLSRNGVVVPGQDDERRVCPSLGQEEVGVVVAVVELVRGRNQRDDVLADELLVTALGGDVDELERARREALGELVHRRRVPRHNPLVTVRQPDPAPGAEPERGFIVGVFPRGVDGGAELAELRELARTAGVAPVAELVQHRSRPDPRTFVGKGKLTELKDAYGGSRAEVLLVDEELSPTQQRSLEDALRARVVDRTQLILDIFAQHARSAEGKLQVELAQLEYNLPRMRGMWQHLERLGGGVGTRGPGESQLESDRRLARTRVSLVKRRLRALEVQRATRRKERRRAAVPTIALAGYTNVGKSTLLNALTGAEASVDDRLFETLDPTTRAFEHDGKRYLVTDTVGFIRRLPTQLVEGFSATLEETLVADLVLHVADASLSEDRLRETIDAVHAVLVEIGADDVPVELVLNKVDLLDPLARRRVAHAFPRALQISAVTGEGLDALKARVAELFSDRFEDVRLLVPYEDGRVLAQLYGLGAPIAERRDTPEGVRVRARLPRRDIARFAPFLVAGEPEAEVSEA
jgi:GTPase